MTEGRENKREVRKAIGRNLYTFLLPVLGACLYIFYVLHAAEDVVYTDYIRIINTYLPDGNGWKALLVPDLLTRIPITYALRAWNVRYFSYSVTVDRLVGILGFTLAAVMVARYLVRERMGMACTTMIFIVMFSLNKWEMLLNGTGFPHFLSYAVFFYTYLVLERWFTGTEKRFDGWKLALLPFLSLMVAGPYVVQYCMTLLVLYGYLYLLRNRNINPDRLPLLGIAALLPMLLYLWSSSKAVYEHNFTEEVGLRTVLTKYTGFSMHFLLNGFASEICSGAVWEDLLNQGLGYHTIYFSGALVVLLYGASLFLYYKKKLYRRTILPLALMISGLGSHALVFLSRYPFLNETYAWQSRYSLQYLPGILGMLLIYGKLLSDWFRRYCDIRGEERNMRQNSRKRRRSRVMAGDAMLVALASIVILTFSAGSVYTSRRELRVMPFRKEIFREMKAAALHYDDKTDDELNQLFEYHHGPNRVRNALDILREYKLNVYA